MIGPRSWYRVLRRSDGVNLSLLVQESPVCMGSFVAVALETTATTFEGVFDDHNHKIIGKSKTPEAAFVKGERYGRKWLKGRSQTTNCICTEISLS